MTEEAKEKEVNEVKELKEEKKKDKIGETVKKIVTPLSLEDYVLFFTVLAFFLFILFAVLSLKQLPSPLYGGDYYHSMGAINHFKYGGNPFLSESLIGSLPHYFPLYTMLVGGLSVIFFLPTFMAMKIFAVIQVIFAVVIFYILGKKIFKNKWLALISVLLYLPFSSIRGFPVWKYFQFSVTLVFPLTILSFFYFYENQNIKSALLAGLMFGLMAISHSVGFVSIVFFISILSIYMLFFQYLGRGKGTKGITSTDNVDGVKDEKIMLGFSFNKTMFKKNLLKTLKLLFIIFIIGVVIAQLYWFKPLFIYQGSTPNPLQDYAQDDFSTIKNSFHFVKNIIFKAYVFNFGSVYYAIGSVLFIAGIGLFFFLKKHTKETRFLGVVLATAFISTFHFIITQPLFGTVLSPRYISCFTFLFAFALFGAFAVKALASTFGKYKKIIFIGFVVILLVFNFLFSYNYQKNDRWINVGRTQLSGNIVAMGDWVSKNTDVNDVFLSTNELSFVLNAMSGRKQVGMRRGHVDLFTDMDKRMLDAGIMLYGNDSVRREELLKEYDVKYLYWDNYWLFSDYQFDDQGKMVNVFDPLMVFKSEERLSTLQKYNISFYEQHTWLDPAVRGDWVKKADFLFILPNQFNLTHPWHPDLDNYIEEIWVYPMSGEAVSKIYKIINVN